VVLELIGYYEGHLSPAGVLTPVITSNSDHLVPVLDHEGRSIETVNDSQVCDLFWIQIAVQVEVPQSNGPIAQLSMESDKSIGIARSDRPNGEGAGATSSDCAGLNRLGVNYRHTATVTSPIGNR
jgi:hypothetical protein